MVPASKHAASLNIVFRNIVLTPLPAPPTTHSLSSRQPRPRPPASIRLNQHSAQNEVLPTNVLLNNQNHQPILLLF